MPRKTHRLFAVAACLLACGGSLADPGDALDTSGGGISRRFVLHAREELEQGHITAALDYCDRALKLYPAYIRAHFERGRALLAAGENDAAIAEFTTVIAAHPEYPMVYNYRGDAYLRAAEPVPAIDDFNRSMKAQTGISSLRAANVFAERSLAFELLGKPDLAMADFESAVKNVSGDLNDWTMFNNSCYTAAVIGRLETALLSCDESISRHSRNMSAYDSRGLAEIKQGAFGKAIADYTQALYYRPDLATSLYGRGIAKQARGDIAGGNTDFVAARASEPHIAEIMARFGASPASLPKATN
jgi:tetratricopeptide (TPR) repeat protein